MPISKEKKSIFVASGNGACRILDKLPLDYPKLFINKEPELVEKYSGLQIGKNVKSEDYVINTRFEEGEASALENKEDILEALKDYDTVILIAPLGGGVSSGIIVKIAEFLFLAKKTLKVIVQLPLEFEFGMLPAKYNRAISAYEYLSEFLETVLIPNYRSNRMVTLTYVYERLDEEFLFEIRKILDL